MSKTLPWQNPNRAEALLDALANRILVIDGAMGTMVQSYRLDESDYRGERFADGFDRQHEPARDANANPGGDLKGNNDLLTLTHPDVISAIHAAYLDAGADLVETNTFNATAVSQADYKLEHLVYELNREGARIARDACDAAEAKTPEKPRFVIGVLGPTSRTASISPDVNDPGFRNIELRRTARDLPRSGRRPARRRRRRDHGRDDLRHAEREGGAVRDRRALRGARRTPAGHDLGHDHRPLRAARCRARRPRRSTRRCATRGRCRSASTARSARRSCARTSTCWRSVADCYVSAHPNAGLPNAFGEYDETPEQMAAIVGEFARAGLVNLVGGCCGTTPAHIQAIADAVRNVAPRALLRAAREAA